MVTETGKEAEVDNGKSRVHEDPIHTKTSENVNCLFYLPICIAQETRAFVHWHS